MDEMKDVIRARVAQLQGERQQAAERLRQLADEMERLRHFISACDGAIGELSALVQDAPGAANTD